MKVSAQITIKIKDTEELVLTVEEAKGLQYQLNELFWVNNPYNNPIKEVYPWYSEPITTTTTGYVKTNFFNKGEKDGD